MNRRYFATYKRWNGSSIETFTSTLGRFADQELAERHARERCNAPGHEIVLVRPETDFEAVRHKVFCFSSPIFRFALRCLRITVAAAIALFTYVWLVGYDSQLGDVPLGDLTLKMIYSALFRGVLLLGVGWLCWAIAFGKGSRNGR